MGHAVITTIVFLIALICSYTSIVYVANAIVNNKKLDNVDNLITWTGYIFWAILWYLTH